MKTITPLPEPIGLKLVNRVVVSSDVYGANFYVGRRGDLSEGGIVLLESEDGERYSVFHSGKSPRAHFAKVAVKDPNCLVR